MKTHMTVQEMYRRDEAMWYMFTRCRWSMQEIADIFKVSKGLVAKILKLAAKRKGDQLENYYKEL